MMMKRSFFVAISLSLSLGALDAEAVTIDSGTQRLIDVVESFSQAVGVSTDVSRLASAGLSTGESAGMAAVLEALLECQDLTDAVASEARRIWAEGGSPEDITWAESMRNCGNQVALDLELLSSLLDGLAPRISTVCSPVNIWPILYYERCGIDTVYLHDYILIVDVGGDDSYFNNAGGSVIDLMRGPASPPALVAAPARGCQTDAELNTGTGNCFLAEAALLDKGGDDTYQRLQTPEADSVCTADLIVRRLATGGSGVGGVGILRDEQGDDSYLGKTLALGMGHAGGFGLLRDQAGVDRYSAIRSSVGAGVLVGLGILEDWSGNDLYVPYDPVGGVIDNTGVCRAGSANLFGAGLLGADGFLREHGGADTYEVTGVVNTLGSGNLAGFGDFHDMSGVDVYNGASGGRGNNACFPTQNGTGAGHFCDSQ